MDLQSLKQYDFQTMAKIIEDVVKQRMVSQGREYNTQKARKVLNYVKNKQVSPEERLQFVSHFLESAVEETREQMEEDTQALEDRLLFFIHMLRDEQFSASLQKYKAGRTLPLVYLLLKEGPELWPIMKSLTENHMATVPADKKIRLRWSNKEAYAEKQKPLL